MVINCVFAEEATPGPHSDLVKWKENESSTAGETIHPAELPAGVGSRPMGPSEHFMDARPYSARNSHPAGRDRITPQQRPSGTRRHEQFCCNHV